MAALAWVATGAQAQDVNTNNGATAAAPYYGPIPAQRAAWQQHLALGPGDVLTFQFYGDTNLTKENVVVGMDGRIGYLQAHDMVATG